MKKAKAKETSRETSRQTRRQRSPTRHSRSLTISIVRKRLRNIFRSQPATKTPAYCSRRLVTWPRRAAWRRSRRRPVSAGKASTRRWHRVPSRVSKRLPPSCGR